MCLGKSHVQKERLVSGAAVKSREKAGGIGGDPLAGNLVSFIHAIVSQVGRVAAGHVLVSGQNRVVAESFQVAREMLARIVQLESAMRQSQHSGGMWSLASQ